MLKTIPLIVLLAAAGCMPKGEQGPGVNFPTPQEVQKNAEDARIDLNKLSVKMDETAKQTNLALPMLQHAGLDVRTLIDLVDGVESAYDTAQAAVDAYARAGMSYEYAALAIKAAWRAWEAMDRTVKGILNVGQVEGDREGSRSADGAAVVPRAPPATEAPDSEAQPSEASGAETPTAKDDEPQE